VEDHLDVGELLEPGEGLGREVVGELDPRLDATPEVILGDRARRAHPADRLDLGGRRGSSSSAGAAG